jgi:ATP-dependent Lon protease
VLFVHRPEQGAWVLLEGVRWVSLEALVQTHPYYLARVADSHTRASDAHAIDELDRKLRDRARRLAATLPDIRDAALAMIEATSDTAQLADLVMANLAGTVDDKAAYARQSDLVRKLEQVVAQLDAELAKSAPPE